MMKQALCMMFMPFLIAFSANAQRAAEVIPGQEWMSQWQASYDVVAYQGDDLFFLINGGADLYLEYGFAEVAAVELKHPQLGVLYVEVYRMDSDSAAFGIFSMRKGNLAVASEALPWVAAGEDFIHLWQGPFYVSASGSGISLDQRQMVFKALAEHLRLKVEAKNLLPQLYTSNIIPTASGYFYLMGPLALNNVYNFGGDIFSISQCLVVNLEGQQQFVFQYPTAHNAGAVYHKVVEFMQTTNRFSAFHLQQDGFRVVDRYGNVVTGVLKGNCIQLNLQKK